MRYYSPIGSISIVIKFHASFTYDYVREGEPERESARGFGFEQKNSNQPKTRGLKYDEHEYKFIRVPYVWVR